MFYFKEKSIYVLYIFLFLALFLPRPRLGYSQINQDSNAPFIKQVSPEDGQTDVPINTSIRVLFSEFMDDYLTNNSFLIDPYIEGQIFWELDQTLIFAPSLLLNYSETYQVSFDTQAAALSGKTLEAPYQWSFVTESSPWLHFYDIQGLFLNQNNVQAILGEDNGDIWVALSSSGSSDDLFIFNGFDPSDFRKIEEPLGHINAIAQDSAGNIWVASESDISELGGVHLYDGIDWIHYNSANSNLKDDNINCLTIDSENNIWMGSYSGIYLFDGASWTNYNTENNNLSNDWVMAIQADEDDHIWIGTFGGIESFDQSTDTWTDFTSSIESQLGIGFPFTNKIVSGSGKIWAITNLGLLSYDIDTNQWGLFSQIGEYPLDNGRLTSLALDSLNNILYIGTDGDVITFDGTNWDKILSGDIGAEVLEIAMDVFGNKWIGTNNSLSRFDTDPPLLLSYTPSANKKNVSQNSKIVLIFSEPMNRNLVLGALSIKPSISFSSSWNAHSTKLTLTPKTELKSNTQYRVTLSKAATDIQGHSLADEYSWSFTTVKSTSTSTSVPSIYGGYSFPGSTSFFGNLSALNMSSMISNLSRPSLSYGGFGQTSYGGFGQTSYGGFGQTSFFNFQTTNLLKTNIGNTYSALNTFNLNLSSPANIYGRTGTGIFSTMNRLGSFGFGSLPSQYPGLQSLNLQTSFYRFPNLNLPGSK